MFANPKVRRAIYSLSVVVVPLLVVLGVSANAAAIWVAAGVAVANLVMAIFNVPGDEEPAELPEHGDGE